MTLQLFVITGIHMHHMVQNLENNMMNNVSQSCKQYIMHMTERILKALHTQTCDPAFGKK
jgi:hypothetical protein